jgi:RHS repeat-associated protein
LGSVLELRDATQNPTVQYTYDPYGNTTSSAASTNTIKYTGREQDASDLYYYRHRYYKPSVGRFISEDPIGLAGGSNTYTYVGNNPVNYIDPLGLDRTYAVGQRLVTFPDGQMTPAESAIVQAGFPEADGPISTIGIGATVAEAAVAACPIGRGGVIANKAAPVIKWGAQEKHFPGHNSYTPGRSTMTSDPTKLAQKAGTGQQVGKQPVGTAGSKERVDFGERIGTYIDQAGNASPTTNGIIHYSNDGIHIVPARP